MAGPRGRVSRQWNHRVRLIYSVLIASGISLLVAGCMSGQSVQKQTLARVPDVSQEISLAVGPRFRVRVTLSSVVTTAGALPGLQAFAARYAVELRSNECTQFVQHTEAYETFGPGAASTRVGGVLDWSFPRDVSGWDSQRRVALLKLVAARGNPTVISALMLREFAPADQPDVQAIAAEARTIGAARGFEPDDLVWLQITDTAELLGFDAETDTWAVLARRIPADSGRLVPVR